MKQRVQKNMNILCFGIITHCVCLSKLKKQQKEHFLQKIKHKGSAHRTTRSYAQKVFKYYYLCN